MMASSFVAVKSVCSAAQIHDGCPHNDQVNNMCNDQRNHVDKDVDFWVQAFDASGYHKALQSAFKGVIKSIGTGPWGSGVWFGDSQMYFLTMMLGSALLNPDGGEGPRLDYYMYEAFCENGGNQCFVLGKDGCADCIGMTRYDPNPDAGKCGTLSYADITKAFVGQPASALYSAVKAVGKPPKQAFDTLELPKLPGKATLTV